MRTKNETIKSDMRAFEIATTTSDYPFLVLAEGFMEAVGILQRQKNVWDGDIINVRLLEAYNSDQILVKDLVIAKESLEEKVRHELQEKMPKWKPEPNGIAGDNHGNALYKVLLDGKELAAGRITILDKQAVPLDINTHGAKEMQIVFDPDGSNWGDHIDLGNAYFELTADKPEIVE